MKKDMQCAIFDLDGTLLDSTDVWKQIDIEFLGRRGIQAPADFLRDIKKHNFESGAQYAVKRFQLSDSPQDLMKEWYDMAIEAYRSRILLKPHVAEYLEHLQDHGIRIAAATSSDEVLYEPCLKRNGIYALFDSFTMTREVTRGKGFPDVYLEAAKKAKIAPEHCVVFEDILPGVQGAHAGGLYTVAVYDRESAKEEEQIRKYSDRYIYDFAELLE